MASLRVLNPDAPTSAADSETPVEDEIRSDPDTTIERTRTWRADRLPGELVAEWIRLHEADGGRAGPFLHPEYARAASGVRDDVEVAVLFGAGEEPVGFMPFQRSMLGVGGPVGGRLCDLAGLLIRPDVRWSPAAVARMAGLRTLRLPNVPDWIEGFGRYRRETGPAPVLDLAEGFDGYRQASLDSGSSFMRQVERKGRKLTRDVEPWRFVWHTDDDEVFASLLRWKSAQRRSTRTPNVLHLPWARALVDRLRHVDDEGFSGVLSALYVGDTLAAAHLGIRSRGVLHYWIPAYNVELASYSPGLLALIELARAASERGIERIDLGSGEERYKRRAATGAIPMATVTVNTNPAYGAFTNSLDRVRTWSRGSRVGEMLRAAGRTVTRGSYRVRSAFNSSPR